MSLRSLAALCGLVSIFVLGCQKATVSTAVEDAPYKLEQETLLRVRPDLCPLLHFGKVERSRIRAEVAGFGKVGFAPGAQTAVRVPFDGFVEVVTAELGDEVAEGAVLARIRSRELAEMRAKVRRIVAELAAEYDARKRTAMLVSENAITERKLIEVKAKIGGMEAERDGILQSLQAARVPEEGNEVFELKAPRGGCVIGRKIEPGENARAPENEPAFIVADPTQLIIRVNFPERDSPLLMSGFLCSVVIPSLGEHCFGAHVTTVVPAVDAERRTALAICKFDTFDERIRSEMLARVTVSVQGEPRVTVPRSAVLLRRDVRVVLVRVGDGLLERRPVTVGANVDSRVEILSGVSEGEEVVVDGAVLLDGEFDRLL